MRILLWATTLQADILALALHLDARDDVRLMVVADGVEAYLRGPVARARPLTAPLLERRAAQTRGAVTRFRADVVVCDNHFPSFDAGRHVCSMWHGLGWKARPKSELPSFYGHVERLTGSDPRRPNHRFFAQCYANRDLQWRKKSWGLPEENCQIIGMAFSDMLRSPPYQKQDVLGDYRIDIAARRTLLVNFTWHYGRIFPGTWQPRLIGGSPFETDIQFIERLFERAKDHRVNLLFCMHDRKRYEARYLHALQRLVMRFEDVELRHKDEHPDNLADLLVADAMVSNMSSFITYFYHFGRPTVHICPDPEREVRFARMRSGWLTARAKNDGDAWMNAPTDNGGLSAFDEEGTLAAIDRALGEPDCCVTRARDWITQHVAGVDGRTCERFHAALCRLMESH